jgi:peptide/nickel transport system substrate-binding protein
LILLACGCTRVGVTENGRHAWTIPGTLRVAIHESPNTLNPLLAADTTEAMLARLNSDLLVSIDPSGKRQIPLLASAVPTQANGGIARDGLTVTYHLRRNVRWQDGVPFSSADVKFSYEALMNPANNVSSRSGFTVISRVDTPDRYTVVFHLKRRYAPFVNTVFGESDNPYTVVPAHLLAKLPDINRAAFNEHPVGTGPFTFVRWVRGDRIEYAANDDYFLGKPKVRRIIVKIVPDENTEVSLLRTHDVDWMFEASPHVYPQIKTLIDTNVVLVRQNAYEGLAINTSRPLLADVNLRRAVAYALDKGRLIADFTAGSATAATEDLPPFMWAYDPAVRIYPHDPAAARRLLDAAGWSSGPDGIRRRGGRRLTLSLSYNSGNATRQALAIATQASLRAVGIEATIKTYPAGLLFAPYGMGGILSRGDFDLNLAGWIAGIDPNDADQFSCPALPPNGSDITRFCSPALDAAQQAALSNYDQATRKRAYGQIQRMLADDVPQIFFWYPRQIQALNPDFKGFSPNPVNEAWNAYRWEI